jgi:hypothetical protein
MGGIGIETILIFYLKLEPKVFCKNKKSPKIGKNLPKII